jgi:hypothetical protein
VVNAPDYIAEQALIMVYRAITVALANQAENESDFSVFEADFPGFFSVSTEVSEDAA